MLPRSSAMLSVLRKSKRTLSTVQPAPMRLPRRGSSVRNLRFLPKSKKSIQHWLVPLVAILVLSMAVKINRNAPWIVFCTASVHNSMACLTCPLMHGTHAVTRSC